MTTTIKSTELDFFALKESLKTHLKQQDEFRDYDFDGAALSNLLDVLSHNTHFNGLIANFALNESYLTTAQLRNSIVSLAESLGYIPTSRTSAQCSVSLTINLAGVPNLDPSYTLLPGELVLRGSIDDEDFTFTNRESLIGTTDGSGVYTFTPSADTSQSINVFEGEERSFQFLVDGSANALYTIPDQDIDTSTAIVKVFEDQATSLTGSGTYKLYTSVFEATTIESTSRLHILRESPNKFYELTFGDNNSLGETPIAGNVIDINYLRSSGSDANGVATLRLAQTLTLGSVDVDATDVTAVVLSRATGGGDPEGIESIRKKAPFQYAAQNRMVTNLDYEALILRKYGNYIEDIICWGGEDDTRRDFGSVYTSIIWKADLNSTVIGDLRNQLLELTKDLSIVSFQLKFVAPSETYVSTELYFQYNNTLSANSRSTTTDIVRSTVDNYFSDNVGKFQQVFRRSNLLTQIDDCDPSVLSSRANVTLQKRIKPILTLTENHVFTFPTELKSPTDTEVPVIKTSVFKSNDKTVFIRNKLTDRVKVSPEGRVPIVFDRIPSTKLEMVDTDGNVIVSNIGSYDPDAGTISILGLNVQSTLNSNNFIKLFATPANESVVESVFSSILEYDGSESTVKAVTVSAKV
jgi:hypothetical protein